LKIRILKTQVDRETERGVWIKLPRSTKKFWLSNRCYFPNGGSASIYINKNFDYLARSGSKTDKKAVQFHEYPDDAPVKEFKTAPSYKRMCITIMKNDHTAKYMGFSRTKEQQEKRRKAMEKYANIL